MRIRVLGPAEIVGADGPVVGLERKPRELLALLAVRAPAAVGLADLTDLLWDDPPPTATRTVQSHISRLRAALAAAGAGAGTEVETPAVVRTGGGGYVLRAPAGTLDVAVVEGLRARARELATAGRHEAAAAALREARTYWRGPVELPGTVAAAAVAARWEHERRRLVEEHLTAVVAGPAPADAVAELEAATTEDPADERGWELLVRAWHGSGRPAAALRAFQTARVALAELGLEPGAALRAAEAAALAGVAPAGAAVPAVPVELPGIRDVRYARAHGVDVAYVAVGTGPPDVVLLNPGLVSIDGLADEPHLAGAIGSLASTARVLALDRRGTGLSQRTGAGPPGLDDWVADVVAVLDACSIGAAVVVASADAALVALALAAAHPHRVRGLALVHAYARYVRGDGYPWGVDPDTARATSDEVLATDDAPGRFDALSHIAPSVAADPAFRRWWDALGRRAASPTAAAALHEVIRTADVRHLLASVTVPVRLLHRRSCASHDIGHSRHLAEHLPDARLVLLPGADDLWFTGDTAPLVDEITAFVAEVGDD